MAASSGYGLGMDGSMVAAAATPLWVVVSAVAAATTATADGSTLSVGIFDFFGGMITSSNNHGGRQCCSRP